MSIALLETSTHASLSAFARPAAVRGLPLSGRTRSAWLEMINGTRLALQYPRNGREFLWTLLLFAARLHLWLLVFINVRLLRRPLQALWQRVETTK